MEVSRRVVLASGGAIAAGTVAYTMLRSSPAVAKKEFPFVLSDDKWKERLSPEAYYVLREAGTERPFSSPLDDEKRSGIFKCAGCDKALFSSEHKYDSQTGWPSFYKALPGGTGQSTDYILGYARTEIHCARCGGHLGHVFNDGPLPTGERWCMNGVAMTFSVGKTA